MGCGYLRNARRRLAGANPNWNFCRAQLAADTTPPDGASGIEQTNPAHEWHGALRAAEDPGTRRVSVEGSPVCVVLAE